MITASPGGGQPCSAGHARGAVMSIVEDILSRQNELAALRSGWESDWADVVKFALPYERGADGMKAVKSAERSLIGSRSVKAADALLDGTAIYAVERLAAGVLALTMPQGHKWHGLGSVDPFAPDFTDEEKSWAEDVTNYLFKVRYSPRAGFAGVNHQAIKAGCALGTGVYMIEESFGNANVTEKNAPFSYSYCPLSNVFLGQNAQGMHDTVFRAVSYTARQAVGKFGDEVSSKIRDAANDPKKADTHFLFYHAVMPRAEAGRWGETNRESAFASYWVEVGTKTLVRESGFFSLPYVIHRWQARSDTPYGESPVMLAMKEIRRLQALESDVARGIAQAVKPPYATVAGDKAAMMRPLDVRPQAVNKGYLDPTGQVLAKPIGDLNPQTLNFVQQIQAAKRGQLQDMLYINLFQILIENSQMTATEVLQRAQEKGDLLGPAGNSFQQSAALGVERELDIIDRKGAFDDGAELAAPETLIDKEFSAVSQSPLDRLRRSGELIGAQEVMQTAMTMAQAGKPEALEKINGEKLVDLVADIRGAPREIFHTDDELEAMRAAREEQASMQEGLAAAGQAAKVAKDGAPAMEKINELLGQIEQ